MNELDIRTGKVTTKVREGKPVAYPGMTVVTSNTEMDGSKISMTDVSDLFKELGGRSADSKAIIKLLPDIKLSMNLLSSLVRKPNGEKDTILTVTMGDTKLPTAVKQDICSTLSAYVSKTYNIKHKLKDIVNNVLFYTGSHVELVLPDVSIQDFIMSHTIDKSKVGIESMSEHISRGDKELAPLTSVGTGGNHIIFANSNMNNLDGLPLIGSEGKVIKKTKQEERADIIKYSLRHPGGKVSETVDIKSIHNFDNPVQTGKPLTLTVPSSVTLPICSKSDPTNHIGYIILVDENGMFVNPDHVNTVQNTDIRKLERLFAGEPLEHVSTDRLYQLYGDKLESELTNYLATTKLATFTNNNNLNTVKEISFQRALQGSKTKLVILDRSQVIYYAVEYNKDGTGKGRLEDLTTLTSLRAMLLYSNVNGSVKNNIGRMKATITLDPADPNPMASLDETLKALLSSKMDDMPIDMLSSKGLTDWIHKAGVQVSVKHPDLPDIEVDVEETGGTAFVPGTELGNEIKDYITRGLGLPPELVDSAKEVDFALRLKGLDSILVEEVNDLKDLFNKHITKHYKCIIKNDIHAKKLISDVIKSNIRKVKKELPKETRNEIGKLNLTDDELADILIDELIPELLVSLPDTSLGELESTTEEFEAYQTKVEDSIQYFFSADALPDELSALRIDDIELLMTMVQGSLMRKWILDRRYIPDLNKMLNVDKYGDPELDILGDNVSYMERLDKTFKPYLKDIMKLKDKIATAAEPDTGTAGGTTDTAGGTTAITGGTTGDADLDKELYG